MNTHITFNGNQVTGTYASLDEATNSAVSQAKAGKTVTVAQILKTVSPNTGVIVTDAASGETQVVK